jgi:outer membrane biosynthesis protein TonB
MIIGLDGKVIAARVVTTTNPKMNDTALNGVRNWKYPPRSDCAAAEADIEFKRD